MSDNVVAGAGSGFQEPLPLEQKLARARLELLDISARNRLLNMPRTGRAARAIDVIDERADEVFRLLAREGRTFTFAAGRAAGEAHDLEGADEIQELAQPEDDSVDDRGVLNRHADTKLQTRLTSAGLQKRLLDLYSDSRTLEEEQGVNILYLTLGSLKWIDQDSKASVRYAPLILIPVTLERGTAAERFKLRTRQEDISANLSLEAFLDRVHGLKLPILETGDDFIPSNYTSQLQSVVAAKSGWEIVPDDITLGFFSFAKFLMYRDLDPDVWPAKGKLTDQPLIRGLLADGFPARPVLVSEEAPIDGVIAPADMRHIVDADSSQALAIHEVKAGNSLVIQGPPGTGKSQTIANIVAAAIAEGKTVLFVAEKMAALEVVKRRLDQAGVGDACLELHSNKANKRAVLDELRRTWELGSPRGDSGDSVALKLTEARDELNAHAERMHRPHSPSRLTPFQVIGALVRLRDEGYGPVDSRLAEPLTWTHEDRLQREKLLQELADRLAELGEPNAHPWWGVGLSGVLPTQLERLIARIQAASDGLGRIRSEQQAIAEILECMTPSTLEDFTAIARLAARIATAPESMGVCLGAAEWDTNRDLITALISSGEIRQRLALNLSGRLREVAWTASVETVHRTLASLPESFNAEDFEQAGRLCVLLPQLREAFQKLKALLQATGASQEIEGVERLLRIGRHVVAAPSVNPEALTAVVWDHGVEQAADLVESVSVLETVRSDVGGSVQEVIWSADCAALRNTLAAHRGSWLRFLSGEWRTANRVVKSYVTSPHAKIDEVLRLLDRIVKGQTSIGIIRDGESVGKTAFGLLWRGDRSSSSDLRAVLDWVRELGPLSREVREIASRPFDREALGAAVECLRALWAEARPMVEHLSTLVLSEEELERLLGRCMEIHTADKSCSGLLVDARLDAGLRLNLLTQLGQLQACDQKISESSHLGSNCFGSAWAGIASEWPSLKRASEWIAENGEIRGLAARIAARSSLAQRASALEEKSGAFSQEIEDLFSDLRLDRPAALGSSDISRLDLPRLEMKLISWLTSPESLFKWVAFKERVDRAHGWGIREVVERLMDGRISGKDAIPVFLRAYYEAVLEEQVALAPELGRFDGHLHNKLVRSFGELDQLRIRVARFEVMRAHHRRIPQSGGGLGPLGVLRAEISKKRGHLPIRQLMTKAAEAVQAIKPVMMMSPLSVAQFLPPGLLKFDLLVMDEASQIQPVDALGAIARCHQVVVVGDERQLPPTRFFSKMTGAQSDEDDSESAQVADIESILGLFIARGMPQRMLRWHYRSRHQSLIAVSNTQFYDNKLFIVPSPYAAQVGRGLSFNFVRDGRFDSGNTRTNPVEARAVAEAVIRHAREYPNRSLGVAAFSVSQRRAIRDQIELLRRSNPDTETFFNSQPAEPFFVKNLENIQGDERDVIFISVGYGKNAQGYMAMAFGPLSSEGGERRLNVLISRAKLRCEVFSSITDEDIDTERGKGKGVFAFKLFLHYARTGKLSLAQVSGRDHDSVFEAQVANALSARGYSIVPQVGIAGFFIDLAVADPDRPGRYVLGIECDGAAYHSARWARDRDRLRQSVLEDHGWKIHRIWSTDWFQRPNEQLELVIQAIRHATAESDLSPKTAPVRPDPSETSDHKRDATAMIGSSGELHIAEPYKEVILRRPAEWPELTQTPVHVMAQLVAEVATAEGPVHLDEVVVRIRSAWNLQRSGSRIQSAVDAAVAHAVRSNNVVVAGSFIWKQGAEVRVRDRSSVSSSNLRKPELLPPSELRECIVKVMTASLGATEDEIVQAALRMLGFKSISSQLREAVQGQIGQLVLAGELVRRNSYLGLAKSS